MGASWIQGCSDTRSSELEVVALSGGFGGLLLLASRLLTFLLLPLLLLLLLLEPLLQALARLL